MSQLTMFPAARGLTNTMNTSHGTKGSLCRNSAPPAALMQHPVTGLAPRCKPILTSKCSSQHNSARVTRVRTNHAAATPHAPAFMPQRPPPPPAADDEAEDEQDDAPGSAAAVGRPATESFTGKPWFKELLAQQQALLGPPRPTVFRFWHDEKRFKGNGDTSLAQRALLAAGGRRTGGNVKSAPTNGAMGWQRKAEWDVLWSPASTAHKAHAAGLSPGQVASAVPGTQSICKKKKLADTLKCVTGEGGHEGVSGWGGGTPPTCVCPAEHAA